MRRVRWFLLLLILLALGWKKLAYACTHPDCLPPGRCAQAGLAVPGTKPLDPGSGRGVAGVLLGQARQQGFPDPQVVL